MRIRLEIPITLREFSTICNSPIKENATIYFVTTDSREVQKGDLFFYLGKSLSEYELFSKDVKSKGGYVVPAMDTKKGAGLSHISDSLLQLSKMYVEKLPDLKQKIAITGSVGKTTTKDFIHKILSKKFKVHKTSGNFNNHIGVPFTLLSAPQKTEILDVEMGMNHSGEIGRLSECLMPTIGIITNIGSAHIGNLGSREAIAKAKSEITFGMNEGVILVPKEEALLSNLPNKMTFSTNDPTADFYLESYGNGMIKLFYRGDEFCVADFIVDASHIKKCLVIAASCAILCGIDPEGLKNVFFDISKDVLGQNIMSDENLLFYTDFYNASFESVMALFDTAKQMKNLGEKSLLLGDVGELGRFTEGIHRDIGSSIPGSLFRHLYFFGEQAEVLKEAAIQSGFDEKMIFTNCDLEDPYLTACQIKEHSHKGEMIFMKASRFVRLERVLEYFNNLEGRTNGYTKY